MLDFAMKRFIDPWFYFNKGAHYGWLFLRFIKIYMGIFKSLDG